MCSRLFQPSPWVRIALLVVLTLLVSAWGTCNAMVDFQSCQGIGSGAQVSSLSPGAIPGNSESVVTVNGSDFTSQSQILWNGNALPTALMDSHQLQTTITQETFASFGGVAGSSVQISVRSPGTGMGCPDENSGTLELVID